MDSMTNKERKLLNKRQYHSEFSKKKHSSSTTGKTKGITATPIQRGFCRRNRSYKNPLYNAVMASLGRRTTKGSS